MRTRSSMLIRLRNSGDDATWCDFYSRYRPLVLGFAVKLGLRHDEAEEVCQDVFAEVSGKIAAFDPDHGRGSFRSWLFQRTDWRVKDKFRARARCLPSPPPAAEETSGNPLESQIPIQADLENLWDQEWSRHRLESALRILARKVPAKKYQAFELHAIREWPVQEVSKALGMNPATVCVNTHRMRKLLRRELDQLLD